MEQPKEDVGTIRIYLNGNENDKMNHFIYGMVQKKKGKTMTTDIAKKMALAAIDALEDKKAEDIKIIDISEVSPLADYFIIANGTNRNQVQALSDNVEELLGRLGYERRPIEGYDSANWILLDYKDIIIHIFDRENRSFYDLERIWRDGKAVTIEDLK